MFVINIIKMTCYQSADPTILYWLPATGTFENVAWMYNTFTAFSFLPIAVGMFKHNGLDGVSALLLPVVISYLLYHLD